MISLTDLHSLALKANCNNLIQISSEKELDSVSFNIDSFFILGAGTNVAFLEDFDGDVVSFIGDDIELTEDDQCWYLKVGAGRNWHELVEFTVERGIGGLENLALIPGDCGAAPVQNIGAYGIEFSSVCKDVKAFDLLTGEHKVFKAEGCCFGYRDSVFKKPGFTSLLIYEVSIALPKDWSPNVSYKGLSDIPPPLCTKSIMDRVVALRQSKLPDHKVLANSGSFFKNPIVSTAHAESLLKLFPDMPQFKQSTKDKVKLSAGWMIEKVGLKGLRLDYLGTYDKHALVIVNHGGGTGEELKALIDKIVMSVQTRFSVKLENEVILIGQNGVVSL